MVFIPQAFVIGLYYSLLVKGWNFWPFEGPLIPTAHLVTIARVSSNETQGLFTNNAPIRGEPVCLSHSRKWHNKYNAYFHLAINVNSGATACPITLYPRTETQMKKQSARLHDNPTPSKSFVDSLKGDCSRLSLGLYPKSILFGVPSFLLLLFLERQYICLEVFFLFPCFWHDSHTLFIFFMSEQFLVSKHKTKPPPKKLQNKKTLASL